MENPILNKNVEKNISNDIKDSKDIEYLNKNNNLMIDNKLIIKLACEARSNLIVSKQAEPAEIINNNLFDAKKTLSKKRERNNSPIYGQEMNQLINSTTKIQAKEQLKQLKQLQLQQLQRLQQINQYTINFDLNNYGITKEKYLTYHLPTSLMHHKIDFQKPRRVRKIRYNFPRGGNHSLILNHASTSETESQKENDYNGKIISSSIPPKYIPRALSNPRILHILPNSSLLPGAYVSPNFSNTLNSSDPRDSYEEYTNSFIKQPIPKKIVILNFLDNASEKYIKFFIRV